jgi:aryl-alcohol dehydrogenase-like predicted oxidoreductase
MIELGTTDVKLGFGCAPLLGRVGLKASLRALGAAFDSGITFYDTARSYGYGRGEELLGSFLRGKRSQVLVSTKFGIEPSKQSAWKNLAKPAVRAALKLAPSLRRLTRATVEAQFQKLRFTPADLDRSLTESLRNLQTDYVDILFMHEAPDYVLEDEDLLEAAHQAIKAGKVRLVGISSTAKVVRHALEIRHPVIGAMQFPCNVFDFSITQHTALGKGILLAANHPFGGVTGAPYTRSLLQRIARSPRSPGEIREKLGAVDDVVLADALLGLITRSTGINVVIPSMIKPEHLRTNLQALKTPRFSDADITWLRQHLREQEPSADAASLRTLDRMQHTGSTTISRR